jgi:hypothetical protein
MLWECGQRRAQHWLHLTQLSGRLERVAGPATASPSESVLAGQKGGN